MYVCIGVFQYVYLPLRGGYRPRVYPLRSFALVFHGSRRRLLPAPARCGSQRRRPRPRRRLCEFPRFLHGFSSPRFSLVSLAADCRVLFIPFPGLLEITRELGQMESQDRRAVRQMSLFRVS